MEVKELISFYVDESSNILEVTFRTIDDSEDFDDDFEYDAYNDLDNGIEFEEVISFLNEYYLVYPNRLPKPELF